nr:MAG: ORF1 [TTV-like mini virus]
MPPFYWRPKRYYWRQKWRYRRFWPRRRNRFWRSRKTLRRKRSLFRRRYRVRKKYFRKKKLKYIRLKEFQPQKIHKCRITGNICLFQCGPNRLNREWTQYMNSYYPEHYEGGGGWSLIKFSLESLFEQRELMRNKWTKSNVLMPLCRYTGCKFKFYRTDDVDYIVHYSLCMPMLDTVYQHTNAQPSNMLLYRKKIIIPSKKTNPFGKLYIKKKLRPPEQYTNKWYFQVDFNKSPLVLLTTTACCLDRFYLNPQSTNNNITIRILNTSFFQTPNFEVFTIGTKFWQPKENYYLYGTENGDDNPPLSHMIFLGQTDTYTIGKPINTQPWTTYSQSNLIRTNFGNPFHYNYLNKQSTMFISVNPPNEVFQNTATLNTDKAKSKGLSKVDQELYIDIRYTPERDTGENQIYLLKTTDTKFNWDEPTDADLIYEGYPLWALLWGWIDWQTKYKKISKIEDNYILVIRTSFTYPEKTYIVPLDFNFTNGISPWEKEHHLRQDNEGWHPKVKFQEMSIENICKTGPGVPKTSKNSIEAHANYSFYFKWGGCPNDLEHITDPADQKHYPVPNNFLQGPTIQNPNADPTKELYCFDFRREMLTERAAKRIKKDEKSETFTFTGSKLQAEPTTYKEDQETQETSTEEEEATPLQQQLQLLKKQQSKLKHKLKRLMFHTPTIKY